MYRITVRGTDDKIICTRNLMEPPSKAVFDELSREVMCDCYVDVCRLILDNDHHEEIGGYGYGIGFEDEVEFELLTAEEQEELE